MIFFLFFHETRHKSLGFWYACTRWGISH